MFSARLKRQMRAAGCVVRGKPATTGIICNIYLAVTSCRIRLLSKAPNNDINQRWGNRRLQIRAYFFILCLAL
tara:strand:+ start:269 stop:487 length:219 start_codon:yes stop_codon:yes gene_type:complete